MGLQEVFKEAAERVKKLPEASNDDKLELYSLFKQSNVGDCNTGTFTQHHRALLVLNESSQIANTLLWQHTDRPGGLFNLSNKAKWDAWNARKGLAHDDAMKAYIDKVDSLCGTSFASQI